jgi:serine/threonine protein kinase
MLNKAGVKLLDFGLAKIGENAGQTADQAFTQTSTNALTGDNAILGTPQYMVPEQIEGLAVDHRADSFAFGCVLYEMVTCKPPFEGKSATTIMAAILERPAPPLPPEASQFDWVINNCLAKDPEARFQNIHDVRLALERVQPAAVSTVPAKGKAPSCPGPSPHSPSPRSPPSPFGSSAPLNPWLSRPSRALLAI